MSAADPVLTPRIGDIARTSDGHLWRVNNIHAARDTDGTPFTIAAVSRLGDHIEMAIRCDDLTVVEAHPGGPR